LNKAFLNTNKTTTYANEKNRFPPPFPGDRRLGFSQRYAIIDTKYILDKMPDYKDAQKQLDDIAAGWQKEIDAQQQELDRMYKDFEAEQVMLSEELRKKREDQLFVKKKPCATCSASALVLKATCSSAAAN
jgi:hypothetical protein